MDENEFTEDDFEISPKEDFGGANPYYNPEDCGLEIIECLDLSEPDYSFDFLCFWKQKYTNKIFCAYDSGCSCPSPFEDYHNIGQLELVTHGVLVRIKEELMKNSYVGMEKTQDLLYKLRKHILNK